VLTLSTGPTFRSLITVMCRCPSATVFSSTARWDGALCLQADHPRKSTRCINGHASAQVKRGNSAVSLTSPASNTRTASASHSVVSCDPDSPHGAATACFPCSRLYTLGGRVVTEVITDKCRDATRVARPGDRTRPIPPSLGTHEACERPSLRPHYHVLRREIHRHRGHRPRRTDPQQHRIQLLTGRRAPHY
jgi:hypothetical protein